MGQCDNNEMKCIFEGFGCNRIKAHQKGSNGLQDDEEQTHHKQLAHSTVNLWNTDM